MAFRGRPATRFFGQTTAGRATSNHAFPLPDGGVLRLTTGAMLDRDGEAYPRGITPEILVPGDRDAIEAAAVWLRSIL
ncbi:S41 family peptidase [Stenotrophomonas sp.]|uniref:S41 family peptidase n=1 Tax=Stenotrophomonas sp. TaxID=69392 RepID=UPI002896F52B|nr:S41 family peptidase [Stenotrophomonas sp.]